MSIKQGLIQDINVPHTLSISNPEHIDYFNIQIHPIRYLYIRIEVLNEQNNIIGEVSGTAIDGSYNISSESSVRRTCDITFNLEENYLPDSNDSLFWINKKFRLYIGLRNIEGDKIYWFDKGVYAIKDPEVSISLNENTIKINGLDKMALYSGDISGQLISNLLSEVQSGIARKDVVKAIMINAGEVENNIIIEDNQHKVMSEIIPYDIENNVGDCVTDALDKVIETLANYQYYYDLDGNFIFKPKPIQGDYQNHNIEWDFEQKDNVIISINRNIDYSNVKNRITIWGGVHDDGYQPNYTLELHDDNSEFGNSPFTIEKLNEHYSDGSIMYRDYVEQCDDYVDVVFDFEIYDSTQNEGQGNIFNYLYNYCVKYNDTYYLCINEIGTDNSKGTPDNNTTDWQEICTEEYLESVISDDNKTEFETLMKQIHAYSIEQCKQKANEMLFHYYLASDTVSITCMPIYSLDVNNVIILNDEKSGAIGFYVVTSISCQLNAGGTMTITAKKLW